MHLLCAGPRALLCSSSVPVHLLTSALLLEGGFSETVTITRLEMCKITATGKLWTRSHFDTEFHFVTGFVAHSVCPFGFWNDVFALSFFAFSSPVFIWSICCSAVTSCCSQVWLFPCFSLTSVQFLSSSSLDFSFLSCSHADPHSQSHLLERYLWRHWSLGHL